MKGTREVVVGSVLVAVLALSGGSANAAESDCPNGAVNAVTNNYLAGGGEGLVGEEEASLTECAICLDVRAGNATAPGGSEPVASLCNIRTEAQAHITMFRIGKCGLIVPAFETLGRFYSPTDSLSVTAVREACR